MEVVGNQEEGCRSPGQRITVHKCGELSGHGGYEKDPGKPYEQHAAQRDGGGDQYVTDAAECAGKDLYKDKNNIAGRNQPKHIDADVYNVLVGGKYYIERSAEHHQEYDQACAYTQGHAKGYAHALFYTVIFSCPVVLSREGGYSNTEGTAYSPEDRVHLAECGPGGGSIRTKIIDNGLDNNIGDAVSKGLQSAGKSDAKLRPQHVGMETDGSKIKL